MKSWIVTIAAPCLVWACLLGASRAAEPVSFALQPGNAQAFIPLGQRGSTRITEKELALVDGLTIRIRPEWLLKNGKWNFDFVDSCVATCRKLNKHYTLLLMSGGANPEKYANYSFYIQAAQQLGNRYGKDPLLYMVHITGCTPEGVSEELHWKKVTPAVEEVLRVLITAWSDAFPDKKLALAIAGGDKAKVDCMKRLVRYLDLVAPGRGIVKNNAMRAATQLGAAQNAIVVYAGDYGTGIGFEMACSSVDDPTRFGRPAIKVANVIGELERRAGRGVEYLAWYRDDLKALGSIR